MIMRDVLAGALLLAQGPSLACAFVGLPAPSALTRAATVAPAAPAAPVVPPAGAIRGRRIMSVASSDGPQSSSVPSPARVVPSATPSSRQAFLSTCTKTSVLAGLACLLPAQKEAGADVYMETDRYGDKELKIATVNKLKQALRNKMVADPSLAPMFLKLAMNDALGYVQRTSEGGLDGSVAMEMDRAENKGLGKGLEALYEVKKKLQRTNELSLADVIAFAGGEAIESVGGPRMVIQIGRYDIKPSKAKKVEQEGGEGGGGFGYEASGDAAGLLEAFKRSGLGVKEMGTLMLALGSVSQVCEQAIEDRSDPEEDDLQDIAWQSNIGSSFGAPSDIFGAKIGTGFDASYAEGLLIDAKKNPGNLSAFEKDLVADGSLKALFSKYVGNNKGFQSDVVGSYLALTNQGQRFETRLLTD